METSTMLLILTIGAIMKIVGVFLILMATGTNVGKILNGVRKNETNKS